MSENPKVSICVITYNHGKYVAEALESVLNQQLSHSYEVIIADDCSSDNTREIINQFAERDPEHIKLLYQKDNVGACQNFLDLLEATRGEYIAYLEGDDYYVDPLKLQKQIDFLEANKDYAGCFHDVRIIDSKGLTLQEHFPLKKKSQNVSLKDLIEIGNNSQTNSRVFRRECIENMPQWYLNFASDLGLEVLIAEFGDWAYMDEVMTTYRKHDTGSFSSSGVIKQSSFLLNAYQHILSNESYRKKFGNIIEERLRHYSLEVARGYKAKKNYWKYFQHLKNFIGHGPKDLNLVRFLIVQELFGRVDKPISQPVNS